jgi:hypothetical protein
MRQNGVISLICKEKKKTCQEVDEEKVMDLSVINANVGFSSKEKAGGCVFGSLPLPLSLSLSVCV